MTAVQDKEFDIFVASTVGSVKHLKYHTDTSKNNRKYTENLVDLKTLKKDEYVTCMRWGDKEQTEMLIGKKNQQIDIYSTLTSVTRTLISPDEGTIVGLGRFNNKLLSASSSGVVRVWPDDEVETGGKLDVMVVEQDEKIFATGGEENDLKVYSVGNKVPTFTAKNMPPDSLQLRRPVWVSSACFSPQSGGKLVAVCSRHGYVRLYDTRARRRPVLNIEFTNVAATCIVPSFKHNFFLVGFNRGHLQQVDLRVGKPDKGFKGCVGAVTDIATIKEGKLIVTTSLDRHVRVHDYQSKQVLYKQFVLSKPSQVLVQTETSTPFKKQPVAIKKVNPDKYKRKDNKNIIFKRMEEVGEKPKNRSLTFRHFQEIPSKKVRPSTEGSTQPTEGTTVATQEPPKKVELTEDESIARLLAMTERVKRHREKIKQAKRAMSVYHNA